MSWLDDLKVGDSVVVENRYGSALSKVTRTTKTQIITKNYKYSKKMVTQYHIMHGVTTISVKQQKIK